MAEIEEYLNEDSDFTSVWLLMVIHQSCIEDVISNIISRKKSELDDKHNFKEILKKFSMMFWKSL